MKGRVDLHTHSNASDGTCTPAEVVRAAAAAGLAGLSLTDHDTLDGIAEARAESEAAGVRWMTGIELSTHWGELSSVHLLGYCVDEVRDTALLAACAQLRGSRRERGAAMVEKLNRAGVDLRMQEIEAEAGRAAIGRPHVARALVAGGWAASLPEAFDLWLVPGRPGYVAQENLETGAAVELLRACGAVPVLAHPQALRLEPGGLDAMVRALAAHGLCGIEAYWSQQDAPAVALCEVLAQRYDLIATGGSDFHGENKPNRIGEAAGGLKLDLGLMDALEAAVTR